jgi:hypothetical protein
MSDEFDHSSDSTFTSFIPLTIALTGFIIWFGFQDYELNAQRSGLNRQFQAAVPTISEAQQINQRYVALMKDLVQTAQKDDAAKAIVNDAIKAGLIHVQPNATNADAAPAAPAPAADASK